MDNLNPFVLPPGLENWIRRRMAMRIMSDAYAAGRHGTHDDIIARDYRRYRAEMAYLTARLYYGRDAMRE